MNLELRAKAAQATIDKFKDQPLAYGKYDCVRMAAYALKKQGLKVSLLAGGRYGSALGAAKALKRLGHANLIDAVDAYGLARIAPSSAIAGDIIALDGPMGPALSVAVGNGRVLGFYGDEPVCIVLQPHSYLAAWRSI